MSLKSYEEYSKKYDIIEGLVDLGSKFEGGLGRRNERAKHVLIFHLDSIDIRDEWHQVLAFFFTGNGASAIELKHIVFALLDKLKEIGVDVKLLVCDQGSNNRKLYNSLKVTHSRPYFIYKGKKYFAIFDWPHLIKRLWYQIRKHKYIYTRSKISNNYVPIVSFQDMVATWRIDQSKNSNLLNLKYEHFFPNNFQAMNVKRTFQVFGKRMASAVATAGNCKNLRSLTWRKTSQFIRMMDNVIDACNSSSIKSLNNYLLTLSAQNSTVINCLQNFKSYCSDWKVKRIDKKKLQFPSKYLLLQNLRVLLAYN